MRAEAVLQHRNRILRLISLIDEAINRQVNRILHHRRFQALEAVWRGLCLMLGEADKSVIIKILNVSRRELQRDLLNAIEFEQSQIFKKVYTNEYDQPGGQPFGLLIGDYDFGPGASDMNMLQAMTHIAAAAFAPFIAGVDPSLLGVDQFAGLRPHFEFNHLFQQHQRWQQLRRQEDARFIGLTLPRILLRNPYNQYGKKFSNRLFQEETVSSEDYLWGNAAFAFACVAIRGFRHSGWLADLRGVNTQANTGGFVNSITRNYFETDKTGLAPKYATDVYLTDSQEKIFSDLGFLPLKDNPALEIAVFYSSQSIQKAETYSNRHASMNAKVSTMLHYILCCSRFAHYVKVIMRDKVGRFISAEACENYLQQWLLQYCAASQSISPEAKARYPLHEAKVQISEQPGMPGKFNCILQIKPHYQLDEIRTHLRLVTSVSLN